MNKVVFLIPFFMLVLLFVIPDADASRVQISLHPNMKQLTIAQDSKITIFSTGNGAMHGQFSACGETFTYSYYINLDKIFYDWQSVEKVKCKGLEYKYHHVYLEVWEGKADNIYDTHEMHYSKLLEPKRESKDYSRFIDPLDILGIHTSFTFILDDHDDDDD